MTGQPFTSSAAFYSLFSDDQARIDRESPLLTELFASAPGNRVADIACGTGLHAAFLAGIGAEVDAFDLSPEMIDQAKQLHPHERITYRPQDMTTLDSGPYDLILCLGNSLSLLPAFSMVEQTFSHVAHCLSPGGLFLTQTLNYDLPAAQESRQRIARKKVGNTDVIAIKNLVPHTGRTLLSITWFSLSDESTTTANDTAILQHLTSDNLTLAAKSAGLHPDHLYGGYDKQLFNAQSCTDMIAIFSF